MSVEKLFREEIDEEMEKLRSVIPGKITGREISELPEPVRGYFERCGFEGMEKMINAKLVWKDVLFKTSPGNDYIKLHCEQFNFVPQPARIVYMKSSMKGFIPLEGRDKFQDGSGSMLIKLFRFVKMADAQGKEMDISALVTILAEALLVPSYALQDYITWHPIDKTKAKAVCRFADVEVSGIFYFNSRNEFIRFETDERYLSVSGKEYKKMKWQVTASDYVENGSFRHPSSVSAAWVSETGNIVYFKGMIDKIMFNVWN
jgi:hypothetical protein